MRPAILLTALLLCNPAGTRAQQPESRPFGTLRQQAVTQQGWLKLRLERVLPRLMRENGVHMWIVPMREYNEDPVFSSLVSPTTMAARRRTIYVFFDRGPERGVERIAIGGTSQGGLYENVRDPEARAAPGAPPRRLPEPFGPDQWKLLTRVVQERDPTSIAVNISHVHAFSDGLSAGEWEQMQAALGERFNARVVRRERLALDYVAERLPEMVPTYVQMQQLVHEIIRTAFSDAVIKPGTTTTDDVAWWLRQRVNDYGLGTWFHPSVDVQRKGVEMTDSVSPVIRRGDVLHCDFGFTAMRLNTDTQHMGYVLREGEATPPAGLVAALHRANRLQDVLLEEMKPGATGNQALLETLRRAKTEGITGTVYTHPIGEHGHGAGTIIGLWDRQEGVPLRGDVPLLPNTWFSIELQATTAVPEWGNQRVRMALEEEAHIDARGDRHWVLRRQDAFHIVNGR